METGKNEIKTRNTEIEIDTEPSKKRERDGKQSSASNGQRYTLLCYKIFFNLKCVQLDRGYC